MKVKLSGRLPLQLLLTTCVALTMHFPGYSQEILAPPSPDSEPFLPSAPGVVSDTESDYGLFTDILGGGQSALEYGIRKLQPRVTYQFMYTDGFNRGGGDQGSETIVQTLTPAVTYNIGEKWALDYAPSLRFYSADDYRDTLEHSVTFSGGTTYEDWSFGFQQTYRNTDSPRVETGTQTEQDRFGTSLSAMHQLNTKLRVQFGLNQNIRLAPEYNDVFQWSTMNWLDYAIAPPLSAGFGVGGGYVNVSDSLDSVYENVMGRVSWQAGAKLSLSANAGVDMRQYLDSGGATLVSPIYGLSASYGLFEHTRLFFNASHGISSSYFQNQVNETTSITGGVNQRLFSHFNLNLSGGYRYSTYLQTLQDFDVDREDDSVFFRARLSTRVRTKASAGVFYYWSKNSSDNGEYSYDSNQVGFDLTYRF